MRKWIVCVTVVAAGSVITQAQWLKLPLPDTPRNADGTPNLSAPTPRTPDGNPDLSGIWRITQADFKFARNLASENPDVSLFPAAEALYKRRLTSDGAGRPSERCLPDTVPDGWLLGNPIKVVQTPRVTLVLYEQMNHYRQVFTDGRKFPDNIEPTWLGYSVATWVGNTLVAETVGLGEQTWLDTRGHPHSDVLRLTERFHRTDFGHIQIEFTINDPKTYRKPWNATVHFDLMPDTELIENICENERDAAHITGK